MEEFNILYIDDSPEPALERYLEEFGFPDCAIEYNELIFDPSKGYKSLINNMSVQSANIIIIDSRLFENRSASLGKFTGEEFKIILKKYYPFIEVIVITQNGSNEDLKTIAKYSSKMEVPAQEYYESCLPSILADAIENIRAFRKIAKLMENNGNWGEVLKEKIRNSILGADVYSEMDRTDIDSLIEAFKQLQEAVNSE